MVVLPDSCNFCGRRFHFFSVDSSSPQQSSKSRTHRALRPPNHYQHSPLIDLRRRILTLPNSNHRLRLSYPSRSTNLRLLLRSTDRSPILNRTTDTNSLRLEIIGRYPEEFLSPAGSVLNVMGSFPLHQRLTMDSQGSSGQLEEEVLVCAYHFGKGLRLTEERESIDIGTKIEDTDHEFVDRKLLVKLPLAMSISMETLKSSIVKAWSIKGAVECKATSSNSRVCLPLGCMTRKVTEMIASKMGDVLEVAMDGNGKARGLCLRVGVAFKGATNGAEHKKMRWLSPPIGMMKINVDVSTKLQGTISIGLIIRDAQDPAIGEALAIHMGLEQALQEGMSRVILESDNRTAIIEDCLRLTNSFNESRCSWICRDANKAAHKMTAWQRLFQNVID
ncbi:hypothetical protein AKJ16_DCAP26368 [Drosera capensis]